MLSHWFERDHWILQESQDGWGFETNTEIGTGTVLQSFNGFGIQRNSGNYLPNVLVARVLSQLPILSLFPMEIVETN